MTSSIKPFGQTSHKNAKSALLDMTSQFQPLSKKSQLKGCGGA